ncbi:MAG: TRAP transporter small permease subunit [Dehalococcoidales bacterium]|nr:TRAP transporter small permease subunit [Dehalococcoidales bacterium]
MTALGYFLKGIDKLSEWTCKISSLTLILLIGTVVYETLQRRFFNVAVFWAVDFSWMLWTFISMMGLAWAQLKGEHAGIDVITKSLSPRMKAWLDLICYALLGFFFLTYTLLVWLNETRSIWRFRLTFPPPSCVTMAVITAGIGLLLLQCVAKFIRDLVFVITGKRV